MIGQRGTFRAAPDGGTIRVGVAHPGTQHSWQTALAFQEAEQLSWYRTSYYYKPSRAPERWLRHLPRNLAARAERELSRRRFPALDDRLVRSSYDTEFLERPIGRVSRQMRDALQDARHRRISGRLLKAAQREPVDLVWGPMDCAPAFDELHRNGVICVLDQPTVHFNARQRILFAEREKYPDYFFPHTPVSNETLRLQEDALNKADVVVVGSEFAARTLTSEGYPRERIVIIPYGYDETAFPGLLPTREPLEGRPIEFLFVGSVTPGKGVHYLLESFSNIDPEKARLTIVGPLDMPAKIFSKKSKNIRYVGQALRSEISQYMSRSDCFVFPSLFEGGGIVLYEAAATGLGIIQTAFCGDGVRTDQNGVVLPEVSTQAIVALVEDLCRDRGRILAWAQASWAQRHERSWAVYRARARDFIQDCGEYRQPSFPA